MDTEAKRLYEMKAEIIQAAGHPIRLAIIDFLEEGPQCVCDIAEHVQAERTNVSRHLAVMIKAGVLSVRRDGVKMIYSLRTPCILKFLGCVTEVLKERLTANQAVLEIL